MARRFAAERYFNCAHCEDLIEPGDEAYAVFDYGPHPVCAECFRCVEFERDFQIK